VGALWAAFRRRWRLAVGLGLLVAAVAAASAWYLTSATSYTVITTLHVKSTTPVVMRDPRAVEPVDFRTFQSIQMSAVKRRVVLNSALREPKVAQLAIVREQQDPLDWLAKEIQVDFSSGPETMRISMIGKDSESLIILLDAVREAYLREEVNNERTQRGVHLRQIEDLQQEFERKMKDKKKVVDQLANALNAKDNLVLAKRQELALTELNQMNMKLIDLHGELWQATLATATPEERKKAAEQAIIPQALIDEAVKKDVVVINYENDLKRIDLRIADYKKTLVNPDQSPSVKALQTERTKVETELAKRREELVPKVTADLRAELALKLSLDQEKEEAKVAKLKQMIDSLEKMIKERMEQNQAFGKKAIDLENQKEEIELVENLWKRAAGEVQALQVELGAPARIETEEPAFASKRDGMGMKAALLAALGGFAAVVSGVSLLEFRARRLAGADEVSQGLRLPVVGTMPHMGGRARSGSQGGGYTASAQQMLIESVDAARAVILHASKQRALRVVMVTSAVGGEGKTMLSAHLSASMARAGWRALLVDADFRRPSLQKVFGLPDQAGLSEVLRGEADLRAVMQPGPMEGLSVITAGECDGCSMQALAQGALRGLFDQVKDEFDLIIVDSAPVLPVVDSQLIAQAVDGVILSVLRDVSRLPLIHAAYERLMYFQVNILGVIVHGTEGGAYGSSYTYRPAPVAKDATPTNPE
jgi:capsular exopolysaccharide synthesis family protein